MLELKEYFFTYGLAGMPFRGGWTRVLAPSEKAAIELFRMVYPDKNPGTVNCAFIYEGNDFKSNNMYKKGNFGAFEHDIISITYTPSSNTCNSNKGIDP